MNEAGGEKMDRVEGRRRSLEVIVIVVVVVIVVVIVVVNENYSIRKERLSKCH